MYVVQNKRIKKGKEYAYSFVAESYWDKGKPKRRYVANISHLPPKIIQSIKVLLKEEDGITNIKDFSIEQSIDYGYFFIILEIIKKLKIDKTIQLAFGNDEEKANIALLMIIGKIVTRGSKLGIVNWIKRNEVLAKKFGVDRTKLTEKDLYSAQFDINNLQEKIEKKWCLYNKKKTETIFLYDITSFYFEGNQNELAMYGYNRDKKQGKKIITAGLLTDENGFPLKIKVFEGNTTDHKTVEDELKNIKEEFGSKEIIFVGDRGMRIRYNLENMNEKDKQGIKYITGLTTSEIRTLEEEDTIQMSLFDKELAEVEKEGKRYVLFVNPDLALEKRNTRDAFKLKFEIELISIQKRYLQVKKQCEENKQRIETDPKKKHLKIEIRDEEIKNWNYKIMKAQEKYRMKEVYGVIISKKEFSIQYDPLKYEDLGKFDGKYVFETTVSKGQMSSEEVRDTYKKLQNVEHAFRDMKTSRLNIRPIFHTKEETTRSHVLIGMFAYAIINEMENKIYPWLREPNQKNEKLSFNDAIEELKMIKLSILSFGEKNIHQEMKITKLNERQKEILKRLNINEKILT